VEHLPHVHVAAAALIEYVVQYYSILHSRMAL
jgi:hypothetical protein